MRIGKLILLSLSIAVLLPPLIFLIAALASGLSLPESLQACIEQSVAERQNLAVSAALGCAPILLLGAILGIYQRLSGNAERAALLGTGGLIPILLVLAWANYSFWSIFLPERVYPGFPHGLELVLGPLIYAPAGMLIGLVTAWLSSRQAR